MKNKDVKPAVRDSFIKRIKNGDNSQLLIPLISLAILVIFNAIRDIGFFSVAIAQNNEGYPVLAGNVISILNGASELAILAMGMTLVTSACGGQDISVGALAAIAGSVFIKVLKGGVAITPHLVIIAFIACAAVAVIFGAFNGTLVAVFGIQPMIATLILFTAGRSVAYWINGGATPTVTSPIITAIGGFIPGIPVPTPVLIVILCGIIFSLLLKFTNLGLYTQAVGINNRAARLNGINTTWIKLLSFMILAICCAVAGCISVGRLSLINHETLLLEIEMDAILAVAIGGNALGGGKFKLAGSVLGAYAIQTLTTTLYAMKVPSTSIKAYKAVVIILIVILGAPVVKKAINKLKLKLAGRKESAVLEVA
ncbi:MAG: ABC transporter permease [Ruminococcus sp.]|jgi:simple sugar transport system permease protein|nr:ABC transporter permease [Ruminococcus sp.]